MAAVARELHTCCLPDADAFASTIRETSPEEFKRTLEVSAIRLAWHAAGCPQCWDVVQRAQQ